MRDRGRAERFAARAKQIRNKPVVNRELSHKELQVQLAQALDRIKNEIADLTLLATEKVLGHALDASEQKRLVEEALAGVDFSALHGGSDRA